MKNIFLKLFTILLLVTSCSESEDETDNPTGADCSSFLIDVANWTNNYNARVQISGGTSPYTKLWSNGETTGTIGGTEGTLEVGTYTVMVTDAKGCVLNGSIIIAHQAAVIENSVECIGSDVAVIRVDVTDNGESEITEKGICYSLTSNPTIDDTTTVFSNIYSHTIDMEPLSLGTTYFVRGYAINSAGVNYGEELSFTTNTSPPVLSIGQYYQGGIIAGISCDGLHGYVVGSSDYGGTWNTANDFCENLVSNGYDDWYLPSIIQVQEIQNNLYTQGIGDFHTGNTIYDNYWASPKHYDTDYTCDYYAFYWDFDADTGEALSICYSLVFRPVRDF